MKPKLRRFFVAWLIGSSIYFLYAIATVYEGIPSLICQPFIAVGFGAATALVSVVVGLPLMLLTPHRPQWLATAAAWISLIVGLLFLIIPVIFSPLF